MARLKATVAKSLKDQLELNPLKKVQNDDSDRTNGVQGEVKVGESCKNSSCKAVSDHYFILQFDAKKVFYIH
jgi:hypothetical protein